MLAQRLRGKKESKDQGDKKEGESSSSKDTESEKNSNPESPKPSFEEEDGLKSGSRHSMRMNNLEKCLEALARRGDLQDVGGSQTLPSRMGHSSLPTKVQRTDPTYFR